MMALIVGVITRIAAASVLVAGAVSCSSAGTVADPAKAPGPVQDLHLDTGAQLTRWSDATGHLGIRHELPGASTGTGCFSWSDANGLTHWQARIAGEAAGRQMMLTLAVDGGQIPPLGRHATIGADGEDGMASLSIDGIAYRYAHFDPADIQGSYFILDNDGTTGLVWIRFASTPDGPQAVKVEGRWRCA